MNESHRPPPRPPTVDAAAFAPPDPATPGRRASPRYPPPLAGPKRSVVVKINADLLDRLRTHCKTAHMSVTDAVLSAHLDAGDDVQQALRPTPEDQRRVALGLPQTSTRVRLGPGKPLSLWLTPPQRSPNSTPPPPAPTSPAAATSPHYSPRSSHPPTPQKNTLPTTTPNPTPTTRLNHPELLNRTGFGGGSGVPRVLGEAFARSRLRCEASARCRAWEVRSNRSARSARR